MTPIRSLARRGAVSVVALAVCLLVGPAVFAQRLPDDPVEAFKQALRVENNKDPRYKESLEGESLRLALDFRKKNLEEKAAKLKTLADLSRALLLIDWPTPPRKVADFANEKAYDRAARKLEERIREEMTRRFVDGVQESAKTGSVSKQIAAANVVAETASSVGELPEERISLYRELSLLVPTLVKMSRSKDPRVRVAACRALGRFPVEPEEDLADDKAPKPPIVVRAAANALAQALADRKSPESARLAAADGLHNLVQLVSSTQPIKGSEPGVTPREIRKNRKFDTSQIVLVLSSVTTSAGIGMDDPAVSVRRETSAAVRQAAVTLVGEIRLRVPFSESEIPYPPRARSFSPEEVLRLREALKDVDATERLFQPAISAFADLGAELLGAAKDKDDRVRLEARRTLNELARARRFLVELRRSIPLDPPAMEPENKKEVNKDKILGAARDQEGIVLVGLQEKKDDPKKTAKDPEKAPKKADKDAPKKDDDVKDKVVDRLSDMLLGVARKLVQSGYTDPDPKGRRAVAEAIEEAGDLGKEFIPRLVRGAKDEDVFVRWISIRALGKLAPAEADTVVPAAARLLQDDDLDVRIAAARTLGEFGPKAASAVPALAKRLEKGDANVRLAAMKALESIGRASTKALPTLASSLEDTDPRIRAEALRVLGRFGAAARSYEDAVQRLTNDRDDDVQKAASAALLAITDH